VIGILVDQAFDTFTELIDFKLFVRRVDKLLPKTIDDVNNLTIQKAQKMFYDLRDDTLRHRLSADVEIKIRAIYFNRIDRNLVPDMISSIYQSVKSLEDIQFLVFYLFVSPFNF
jgi:hypothetical protein